MIADLSELPATGNERCTKCHSDPDILNMPPEALAGMVRIPPGRIIPLRTPENIPPLYIPLDRYAASAHGKMECIECHSGIELLPHDQRLFKPACVDCHAKEVQDVNAGMHRPDIIDGKARPSCADCHGSNAHFMSSLKYPRDYGASLALIERCVQCHGPGPDTVTGPGPDSQARVKDYMDGTHGRGLFEKGLSVVPTCVECHGSHKVLPESDPESQIHPRRVPKMCGSCHPGIEKPYLSSVHGQHLIEGKEDAASCTSCHRSHGVEQVDQPFLLGIIQECSQCHLDLAKTYLTSYHGKAATLGDGTAAVCSSCHGAHDILPKSDPASRVAPGNLKATCGTCHEKVNDNFVKYITHTDYRDPSEHPIVFYTWAGMMLLLLGTLAFFIPHTLLWFQRSFFQRLLDPMGPILADRRHKQRMVQRFAPIHRFTHFLIVVSFMGLVVTGFPLKYSHTDWAHRITDFMGGVRMMGFLHRVLAVVTFTYVLVHVGFLVYFFAKKCPKPRWKFLFGPESLLFSRRDLRDFFAMMRWFFWRGPRPRFERWTYFEKFDYFGEIWGVIVIGGTGLILWAPQLFTRWLPGWILNCATVIHSVEALLAASVIFLVHFFNTHLRPEKFPIDMVMLTGQMTEAEMQHERGVEYDRLVAEGRLEEKIVKPVDLRWRFLGALAGIGAFLLGIALIVLALVAEIHQIAGSQVARLIQEYVLDIFK